MAVANFSKVESTQKVQNAYLGIGCSGLGHWDDPEGWDGEGVERGGSVWGTYGHPWWIQVNVWQNQHNVVK